MLAGVDPRTLRKSNTGLFQGSCFPEYHKDFKDAAAPAKYIPNQVTTIARYFGFRGPYVHIDTACGSAACALNEAFQAIKKGLCDQALVTGANSVFQPVFSYEMLDLKMISKDGKSKCMDESANGYARSEAVAVVFLQKKSHAKRVYCTILNSKTNADGWKPEGVTFPGIDGQAKLLRETYKEIGVDPLDFEYVEAHTTGTAAGDPVELNAIYNVLCTGRQVNNSLLIGCIKSNIGHSEGASGLCALIKSLFILQDKKIPPNLHFKTTNPNIKGLMDGLMTPVNTVSPFHGDTIPVNCFGFGGANVHIVIRSHDRPLTPESFRIADVFPRVITVCGRSRQGVDYILNTIQKNPLMMTREFLSLLNDYSKQSIRDFPYRTFMLVTSNKRRGSVMRMEPVKVVERTRLAIYFPDDAEDPSLAFSLLSIPRVAQTIKCLEEPLKHIGVDLVNSMKKITRTRKESIAINLAYQIAMSDLIKSLGIHVDEFAGRSTGELSCGYFDGITSAQQVIVSSFCAAAFYYSEENLKTSLRKLTIRRVRRSPSWLSDGPILAGGDFFADHILCPRNGAKLFSPEAIVLEAGPWGLRKLGSKTDDACLETIKVLGELYINGITGKLENIYPHIQYPLPSVVPSLSSLIKWDHSKRWSLDSRSLELNRGSTAVISKIIPFTFDKQNPEDAFLFDHKIDSRILFPATGYLAMAWFALSKIHQKSLFQVPVKFSDVLIERATVLVPSKAVSFVVRMDDETGSFVVKEGDSVVVSGKMQVISDFNHYVQHDPNLSSDKIVNLEINDIYKEFRVRGYDYDSFFQGLHSARSDGKEGKVIWRDIAPQSSIDALNVQSDDDKVLLWLRSWISFADSLIQLTLLNSEATGRALLVPTKLESLVCSPKSFIRGLEFGEDFQDPLTLSPAKLIPCTYHSSEDIIASPGLILKGLKVTLLKRNQQLVRCKSYRFVPFNEVDTFSDSSTQRCSILDYHATCVRLANKILTGNYILDTRIFFDVSDEKHSLLNLLSSKLTHKDLPSVDLRKDLLLGSQENESVYQDRFLKPFFDLMTYNLINKSSHSRLDVLEVTPSPDASNFNLQNKLQSLMEESLFSDQTTLSYSLFHESSFDASHPNIPSSHLVIYRNYSSDSHQTPSSSERILKHIFAATKDAGFLLLLCHDNNSHVSDEIASALKRLKVDLPSFHSREDLLAKSCSAGFEFIGEKYLLKGVLPLSGILLRKRLEQPLLPEKQVIIEIGLSDFESWLEDVKSQVKEEAQEHGKRVWLCPTSCQEASEKNFSGLLGFVKSLRLEPGGDNVRCILDWTHHEGKVSFESPRYQHLLKTDLVYNIIYDKSQGWGSFEHLFFSNELDAKEMHSLKDLYLKCMKAGDLSSLLWTEGDFDYKSSKNTIVDVNYAALNFKDIMYASGRLAIDSVKGIDPNVAQDSLLGMEFAGTDVNGNRIMGVLPYKALATKLSIDDNSFLLPVPNNWSLEEASTVPVVYSTAFYGLVVRGQLRSGESVLIHSGAGGVGMASINIALSRRCTVYTTVGTKEKKEFLLREFPKLERSHIFFSRDVSFEEDVMRATDGRGVDLVLNSLSGEKLQASLRCVAENGRFIEIGKVDLLRDADLFSWQLSGNRSMHGVYPESFFRFNEKKEHYFPKRMQDERAQLKALIVQGMKEGVVRPLIRTVFEMNKVEDAFRFMASGKHVGKVIIKIQEDSGSLPNSSCPPHLSLRSNQVMKVTHFNPLKSYLVIGGLGGFGLEMIQWMAERGARNIVVNSRRGIRDSYHKYCVQRMESLGTKVLVSQADSTTQEGVKTLIEFAASLGPVGGIFNTAAVFDDMLFSDQTIHTFNNVTAPKVKATLLLDKVSRALCPELEQFVAFSSISTGRGNPGQTSYNFANSILDCICDKRRQEGLPGLSIQWGVIGDTGYVAEKSNSNNTVILGLTAQRMHSCLSHLDMFIQSKEAVVTCYVKAEKSSADDISGSTDILKVVSRILGLKDIQSLDPNTTLGNLGIDSLIAVEIQQILERIQGSSVPLKNVKELKIAEFVQMTTKSSSTTTPSLEQTEG